MYYSSQAITQLHLCYHLYNYILLVGFFGGCLALSLAVMTFYGMVGVESAVFLSSVGFWGLIMMFKPAWLDDESEFSYDGTSTKKSRGRLLCELAVNCWTLGKDEKKDKSLLVCPGHRDSSCPICWEAFQNGQEISVVSTCQHAFHSECLQTWAKKNATCPYCRQDMEKKNPKEEAPIVERCRLPGALGIFEGQFDSIFDM